MTTQHPHFVKAQSTVNASQFRCVDLRAVIRRANDILLSIKELKLRYDIALTMIDQQVQMWSEGGLDEWDRLAWTLVRHEVILDEEWRTADDAAEYYVVNGNL